MSKNEVSTILQIFQTRFGSLLREKHKGANELLLLLSLGLSQGWSSINSVSIHLGIQKDKCYSKLNKLPLRKWRALFESCFKLEAMEKIAEIQQQSLSTQSRSNISIQIDDSVLRKWMGKSYFSKWYSGQYKKVVSGYDVVLVSIVINAQVFPLTFWLMAKTGPYKKRPSRSLQLIKGLCSDFQSFGIDVTKLGLSTDAAYLTEELKSGIVKMGFKLVMGGKGHYKVHQHKYNKVYESESIKVSEVFTETDYAQLSSQRWAIKEKVVYQKVKSPTFGEALLLETISLGKPRRVFAFGVDRACEAWRIWKNHHKIEQVFRSLKHLLSWGKYALQGKNGAYATVVIPFLAFWLIRQLQKVSKLSLEKNILALQIWFREDSNQLFESLNLEHFQVHLPTFDSIMGNSG